MFSPGLKADIYASVKKLESSVEKAEESCTDEEFQEFCDFVVPTIVYLKEILEKKDEKNKN